MTVELVGLTLAQASAGLDEGQFSSIELVTACLDRIEAFGSQLNCFVEIAAEEAMAQATLADEQRKQGQSDGPLQGIPLAVKDMFFNSGKVSSMGSRLGSKFVPTTTASVLKKLESAGAISIGTLHMAEFAAGPTGQNDYLGFCKNPWNQTHITGGSSSGSGCAVAARMVYGSIGSDTGGSIRLPAGMCGVVGLKPTHGLVSRHGGMPRCWSLDVFGPIARTAMDCALLLEAIEGFDQNDPATYVAHRRINSARLGKSLKGIRVGLPGNCFASNAAPEVVQALDDVLDVLREVGCTVVPIDLPPTEPIYALTQIVNKAEAAALHSAWLAAYGDEYGMSTKTRMEAGFYIPATLYLWALTARPNILRGFVESVFTNVDVLLLPLLAQEVPAIADVDLTVSGDVPATIDRITRYTRWVSYLGLPAIVAPCGFSRNRLPISFQLMGRPYSEQLLLDLVHQYEGMTAWHRRAPALEALPTSQEGG
ncbi:aspartyl/glutamyl-tRNA(Asn/Gln) amidotransferase subunit A [Paralcaligenes ureilyticus]|uniref:Aspartyl/glutamyl-tRNA(Asn/Gln) amidotransferase subunit A n=2 Tax=Paralcaligenes ureilyticus TaxID=627131 RepID=A0A4V2UZ31_9BURK|nr:aspartyl/glutamyl-tRNA(Asn/Gln) amidotransferase subunit A [Paralcaligenes ureilyticus]